MKPSSRWFVPVAAIGGIGVLGWTVASVGPMALLAQGRALGLVLPLTLAMAAARFLAQAAGWRLALPPAQRPLWKEAFAAVVAGEAAGYFGWGPASREPVKAMLIEHRAATRVAIAAALLERGAYAGVAALLSVVALGMLAVRMGHAAFFLGVMVTGVLLGAVMKRLRYPRGGIGAHLGGRVHAIPGLLACGVAQEAANLCEAYVVLLWLGATPTLATVVVLEGMGRLANSMGQFIPGKLGVPEAASTLLASVLALGGPHGLGLALARRARSLLWGAAGIGLLTWRTARPVAAAM